MPAWVEAQLPPPHGINLQPPGLSNYRVLSTSPPSYFNPDLLTPGDAELASFPTSPFLHHSLSGTFSQANPKPPTLKVEYTTTESKPANTILWWFFSISSRFQVPALISCPATACDPRTLQSWCLPKAVPPEPAPPGEACKNWVQARVPVRGTLLGWEQEIGVSHSH